MKARSLSSSSPRAASRSARERAGTRIWSKTSARGRSLQGGFDDRGGPVLVERHEPLVEPDVGVQLGLLAQERREEAQARDVLAQDRQADRQRASTAGVPSSPQSHVQNIAATSSPRAETPVVLP